jgi:hypothetical protein
VERAHDEHRLVLGVEVLEEQPLVGSDPRDLLVG